MTGAIAFVSGGAGGIGFITALRLARRGYRVMIGDASPEAIERALATATTEGLQLDARQVDVTSTASVDDAVDAAAQLGPLSVAVTCAGVVDVSLIADMTDESWDRAVDVNLSGTMRVMRAAVRRMPGPGSLVTVASVSGRTASTFASAAYVASKAGVIGFTKSLAAQLAEQGIRVNCVAPGIIDTPMIADYGPERRAALLAKIPMGRLGVADDVARAIEFLATPDSDFVTGHVVDVNGGQFIA